VLRGLSWTLLVLAGTLSLGVDQGWLGRAVVPDLALVPTRLGELGLTQDLPVAAESLGELPPEAWLFRGVRTSAGGAGRLFATYFERGRRWSGRPHDVDTCYRATGWEELAASEIATSAGAILQRRLYARDGERIVVVHWLARPGERPGSTLLESLQSRVALLHGLRQDVASVYWEFPEASAPADAELARASDDLFDALERLWR
jgi:hypothetical protein